MEGLGGGVVVQCCRGYGGGVVVLWRVWGGVEVLCSGGEGL